MFMVDSLRKAGCEPGPIDDFIVCRRASEEKMTAGFVPNLGAANYRPQVRDRGW
jgi:hypothetical protein